MDIREAARMASDVGGWMIRKCEGWMLCVKPANGPDCCLVMTIDSAGNKKTPGKRWNPEAADLIAEDWMVSTEL